MIIDRRPEQEDTSTVREPQPQRTIKSMSEELRPREKALAKGIGVLTLPELWAVVMGLSLIHI